jgi:hypothetical protein
MCCKKLRDKKESKKLKIYATLGFIRKLLGLKELSIVNFEFGFRKRQLHLSMVSINWMTLISA